DPETGYHVRRVSPTVSLFDVCQRHDPKTHDPAFASVSLVPYLSKPGVVDIWPTTEIICEQGYEIDRPSRLTVHVHSDDDEIEYVTVGGRAVMVIEGSVTF